MLPVKEMPRVYNGKAGSARRAEGEAMLADQVRGMRLSELAKKYDVSPATVCRRLKQALDERIPATVDARREQINASLDEQMAEWQKSLEVARAVGQRGVDTDDVGLIVKGNELRAAALAGIWRVDERRARLNGTDAPVKAEVEVVQVTAQERELRDLLEQAARDAAVREATLIGEQQ